MFILMMLLLGGGVLATGVRMTYARSDFVSVSGLMLSFLGGLILLGGGIGWPLEYAEGLSNIERFKAVEATIIASRDGETADLEAATILRSIGSWNAWLADEQYWNGTFWLDWTIPDGMDALEPIR